MAEQPERQQLKVDPVESRLFKHIHSQSDIGQEQPTQMQTPSQGFQQHEVVEIEEEGM